jgi:hypothetical protein
MAKTVPTVDVLFKMLVGDTPNAFTSDPAPLSNFPHYRIGPVWRGENSSASAVRTADSVVFERLYPARQARNRLLHDGKELSGNVVKDLYMAIVRWYVYAWVNLTYLLLT